MRQLIDNPRAAELYPADALDRAREYLCNISGGTGAYSESKGAKICREHVAYGISNRDGYSCDIDDLWLTDGASSAVHMLMQAVLRNKQDAVLVPIPQYPLYSAAITLNGGSLVPYYLDESKGWQCTVDHLRDQLHEAKEKGLSIRAMVVINPGNPTGQILDRQMQETIIKFCRDEALLLVADEVYQTNIYAEGKKFISFKRILRDMGSDAGDVRLVSLNSISKGFSGECGRRGGYMECINFPEQVREELYKLASISLCSNINGQICIALMMKPPTEGDPSFELYEKERKDILDSLKRRAALVAKALDSLEGVTCNPIEGALYAFPRLQALEKKSDGRPDSEYCMKLLDETGIVTVPGSGFGQATGTCHLRTTILPPEGDMEIVVDQWKKFHRSYLKNLD